MLYDPKWEAPAMPDLEFEGVALRDFAAWLETMPATEVYNYINPAICATAQYLESKGKRSHEKIVSFGLPHQLNPAGIWLRDIVGKSPYTFGAALSRARELLASR